MSSEASRSKWDRLWKQLSCPRQNGKKKNRSKNVKHEKMILDCEEVDWVYNLQAGAATYSLLAGYLVLPTAFKSLAKSENEMISKSVDMVQKYLLLLACVLCAISSLWLLWLWFKLQHNYVWLQTRIFL
jgi:hypothetical protein